MPAYLSCRAPRAARPTSDPDSFRVMPAPPAGTADAAADHLYALEPEQFVEARDQLAKELRAGGEPDAAKAVKALRRPTVAAWAVNQLARQRAGELDELLDVTRALEEAQRQALTGSAGDLRTLRDRRQRLIDELTQHAQRIIEESGRPATTHVDDVVRTLQATSEPELAERVREGRLSTPLVAESGLAGLQEWFETSGASSAAAEHDRRRARERAVEDAAGALDAAEHEVRAAEAEVAHLRRRLREAERRVERLAVERDARRDELATARAAVDDEEQR